MGSPPRVWGILRRVTFQHVAHGITPTCVGNTSLIRRTSCARRDHPHVCGEYYKASYFLGTIGGDHPHVCGEYLFAAACDAYEMGSPPRVWGIPFSWPFHSTQIRDHPHVCGEYQAPFRNSQDSLGSPPRVWGIQEPDKAALLRAGITPTCVGNTLWFWSRPGSWWDHPHVCGEYLQRTDAPVHDSGSPPRVWGIPNASRCRRGLSGDHPHVCGEYLTVMKCKSCGKGSPPRVWGIPPWPSPSAARPQAIMATGITPTCVGNTNSILAMMASRQDHPHVCGEYDVRKSDADLNEGSPPRVWGILALVILIQVKDGITPTCVGNT